MASMDYENENGTREYEEAPRYERDRSASPRPNRRESPGRPRRSASPGAGGDSRQVPSLPGAPKNDRGAPQDDGAVNPGSNLFVTGIHPRLSEQDVTRLFEKYGDVEKCQIMLDPHTKESRGFGFVKMVTAEQADAAKEALSGEQIEGRTLSIEKARRSRPRTPTPGKYFEDDRPPRYGGDRYGDDRRRGGYRDYGRRDDYDRGYRGGRDRYDDRGPDRYYDDRRGGDRRGGGYGDRYERGDRESRPSAQYGDPAPRREAENPYGTSRSYADERYRRD
ncbi:hypothetical protein B0O99DRAFT_686625 [Bisporella sp. PMI_857]|nr:hypothetical protein B0O99DRAFT_686625 [Bisporella sp. PMI_857]